jgi:Flp pilus assembly protein TadG
MATAKMVRMAFAKARPGAGTIMFMLVVRRQSYVAL